MTVMSLIALKWIFEDKQLLNKCSAGSMVSILDYDSGCFLRTFQMKVLW